MKVVRDVPLNESDPALLAPTVAEKPTPSSKERFESRKTSFKTTKTVKSFDNSSSR